MSWPRLSQSWVAKRIRRDVDGEPDPHSRWHLSLLMGDEEGHTASRAAYGAPDADVNAIYQEWVADLTRQLTQCGAMISYGLLCGLPRDHEGPHMGLASA